jgi:hypothetical protein
MNALFRIMYPYMKLASTGSLGIEAAGSFDAYPQGPERQHRLEDNVSRAFGVNEAVDDDSRMPESSVFNGGQKYASKAALGVIKPPKVVGPPKPSIKSAPSLPGNPMDALGASGKVNLQATTVGAPSRRLAGNTK